MLSLTLDLPPEISADEARLMIAARTFVCRRFPSSPQKIGSPAAGSASSWRRRSSSASGAANG